MKWFAVATVVALAWPLNGKALAGRTAGVAAITRSTFGMASQFDKLSPVPLLSCIVASCENEDYLRIPSRHSILRTVQLRK